MLLQNVGMEWVIGRKRGHSSIRYGKCEKYLGFKVRTVKIVRYTIDQLTSRVCQLLAASLQTPTSRSFSHFGTI